MRAAIRDADIFTLFHRRGSVSPSIERHRIQTSFVQRLPFGAHALPAATCRSSRSRSSSSTSTRYDLVISSSHCAAKAVVAPGRARHLCYCHSPMRYAWDQFDAYFGPARVGPAGEPLVLPPGAGAAGAVGRGHGARACTASSPTPRTLRGGSADTIIARRRSCIRLSTRSSITPPPIAPGSHFLIVSALVPVQADRPGHRRRATGSARRLRIVGDGPDRAAARARSAGPDVDVPRAR